MIIQHNLLAMNTGRQLNINQKSKAKITERLSSGYKINRAADNAAGLAISEEMRAQIRGLNRGAQNVQEGINFCNTAEGALNEVHSILDRIKELSVQAANDTNVASDREAINNEIEMLKKEINRISEQTEYNTYKIFSRPFEVTFSDDINVIQIFDANDGDPSDPESYGGIIINSSLGEDTRVSWNTIDPNMVYKNPKTGQVLFHAGTYKYDTGIYKLTIKCKEGSKPPEIKASFPITGTDDGINIAGKTIEWEDILNENNDTILNHIGEEGYYHFKIGSGEGSFYVKEFSSLSEIKNGINACNKKYSRKYINEYNGYYKSQAINITDIGSNLRVNNDIAKTFINKKDMDIRLKADKTGIWIVNINEDGTDGAELSNSKKTWEDLGITSWDSKNDISDIRTYHYTYKDNDTDPAYNIQFNFTLLDETSIDSVIAGINNANISDKNIRMDNGYGFTFTAGNNVESGTLKSSECNVSIFDEIALGRNFGQKEYKLGESQLKYDSDSDSFSLSFADQSGNNVITLSSSSVTGKDAIQNNAQPYENYLIARQVQKLLSGSSTPTYPTLDEVIGKENIIPNSSVTLNNPINATQKLNGTYSLTTMDFSGMGDKYHLYDLLGMGFNSTCATCSNHYSIMFVYGGTDQTASNGVGYTKTDDGMSNYTLQIDLKQMIEKGITDGKEFTEAIVKVMDESKFDFHFQQYASDGAKLYVCDNRHRALGSFDTKPYEIEKCTINIGMKGNNGNSSKMQLQYVYNLKNDLKPLAEIEEKDTGSYIKDDSGKLLLFDANDDTMKGKKRYDIKITNNSSSWENYYDTIMGHIADQSAVTLNSKDYVYVDYAADERDNSATVSTFDFHVEDQKGFWIQAGANTMQGVLLRWETFSTYTLGIGRDNALTQENAEKLIGDVDKSIEIISGIRSVFGAYTNRLEHSYSVDKNTAENLQAAESKMRDADMADEIVQFSIADILSQAAQAMLAQANQAQNGILQLLQ